METETTISQGLRVTDGESKYDEACKRLLSEKAILARIMKACMTEYQDCAVNDIAEKYIEGQPVPSTESVFPDEPTPMITGMDTEDKSRREHTVNYDIKFRSLLPDTQESVGIIVNVEAQNKFRVGYPFLKRGIYYCCRMISSQYGREFTKSHYGQIKKVYSIWIFTTPPTDHKNSITRYRLIEEPMIGQTSEPVETYDLLSLIMVYLGGAGTNEENYKGILRMLDVLLSDKFKEDEKRQILHDEFDIEMTQTMEKEMSSMCNLSQRVRENAYIENIRNLAKNMQWTIEQAMDALGIAPAERETYRELLKEQPS